MPIAFMTSKDPSSLTSARRTSVRLCACSIRMSLFDINSSDFTSFLIANWYKTVLLGQVLGLENYESYCNDYSNLIDNVIGINFKEFPA